ncbi:MAG: flagellar motor switch protein FliN [Geminicoccaceae bacterium]
MSDKKQKLDLDELASTDEAGDDDIELSDDHDQAEGSTGEMDDLSDGSAEQLGAIYDVPVQVSAVLGRASMPVSQLVRLGRGAILELDRKVGESIDVAVNNRIVARGEVVIIDDRIGITMTEIIKSEG